MFFILDGEVLDTINERVLVKGGYIGEFDILEGRALRNQSFKTTKPTYVL